MEPIAIIIAFFSILSALMVGSVICVHKKNRIVFGIITLAWASLMFLIANEVQTYNLNIWYSGSAAKLLDESIKTIDSGRHKELEAGFKDMRENLVITYENRGNFKELADKLSSDLAIKNQAQQAASSNR